MKGRVKNSTWVVSSMGGQSFIAERIIDGELEQHELDAHCLQCAKEKILSKYGGKVDLRGSHHSLCGSFLRAMQHVIDEEEESD